MNVTPLLPLNIATSLGSIPNVAATSTADSLNSVAAVAAAAAASGLTTTTAAALSAVSNRRDGWLRLEVCREFQRQKCSRTAEECKYAHPPSHVEQEDRFVVCCYDSLKNNCKRTQPPCKFFHPPEHLKAQLLESGKQNLQIKNSGRQLTLIQQMALFNQNTPMLPIATAMPLLSNAGGYGALYHPALAHSLLMNQSTMASPAALSNLTAFGAFSAQQQQQLAATLSAAGLGSMAPQSPATLMKSTTVIPNGVNAETLDMNTNNAASPVPAPASRKRDATQAQLDPTNFLQGTSPANMGMFRSPAGLNIAYLAPYMASQGSPTLPALNFLPALNGTNGSSNPYMPAMNLGGLGYASMAKRSALSIPQAPNFQVDQSHTVGQSPQWQSPVSQASVTNSYNTYIASLAAAQSHPQMPYYSQ